MFFVIFFHNPRAFRIPLARPSGALNKLLHGNQFEMLCPALVTYEAWHAVLAWKILAKVCP